MRICFYTRIVILLVVFNMLIAIVFLFGYKTENKNGVFNVTFINPRTPLVSSSGLAIIPAFWIHVGALRTVCGNVICYLGQFNYCLSSVHSCNLCDFCLIIRLRDANRPDAYSSQIFIWVSSVLQIIKDLGSN